MIRYSVLHFGRPVTWAMLITGALLLALAILWLTVVAVRALIPDGPISPREALEKGGHTIIVLAVCEGTGAPIDGGTYEVITIDGRPPTVTEGELASNMAQVVVGPDWVGYIKIELYRGIFTGDFNEISDLIGEPYGWHTRTIEGYCPSTLGD